jgi:uncharacterized lipoprotein YmbA
VSTARTTLILAALLLISCSSGAPVQDYASLTANAGALRSAFNADSGAVRAIYLASPT